MAKSRTIVSPRYSRNHQPNQNPSANLANSQGCTDVSDQKCTMVQRFLCMAVALAVTTLSLGFSGCCWSTGCGGNANGLIDRFMEKQVGCMRDHVWAKRAFHLRYGHCERVHADHFRDGFISGYGNVCGGHGSECPALPPEKYWSYRYRSQEGAEMQAAWFAGFESGAGTAKVDGVGTFQDIQISRDMEQAMLAADQINDLHSGIEKEYIIDMAPVRETATQPGMSNASFPMPQTNMPYIGGQSAPVHVMPMSNTPVAQPALSGPMTNQPMPMQIVPARVPVVPGQSQR